MTVVKKKKPTAQISKAANRRLIIIQGKQNWATVHVAEYQKNEIIDCNSLTSAINLVGMESFINKRVLFHYN